MKRKKSESQPLRSKNAFLLVNLMLFCRLLSLAQLPTIYLYKDEERHLSLKDKPEKIEEFYYEYRSQIRGHTFNHQISYDNLGRVVLHKKDNAGLYDSLPPVFKIFTDSIPTFISYRFEYDSLGRYKEYEYLRTQGDNPLYRILENWTFDAFGMQTDDILTQTDGEISKLNSNSTKRLIIREIGTNKVKQIIKYEYVFLAKKLKPYEAEVFEYEDDTINKVKVFYLNEDSISFLKEEKVNLSFKVYNDLNTDKLLLNSYTSERSNGDTLLFNLTFGENLKPISNFGVSKNNMADTLEYKLWIYTDSSLTKFNSQDDYTIYIYDSSNYSKTEIEYIDGYPVFEKADFVTRVFEAEKLEYSLVNTWESAINIWLKDKEYLYYYDDPTGLAFENSSKNELAVYPNPCKNVLFADSDSSLEIAVFDSMGNAVLIANLSRVEGLDLEQLASGLFFYQLENGNQGKLILE
jgi:hypothetical protein